MKTVPSSTRPTRGQWLVVAAWPPELVRLRRGLVHLPPNVRKHIAIGTVGVGLVEAAAGAARLIAEHEPEGVLLIGTAGAYPSDDRPFPIGSLAIARRTRLLPLLLRDGSSYVPAILPLEQESSRTLVRALSKALRLPEADVACPLAITASAKAARQAAAISDCALENLEAFAVARAAAAAHVPFAAILGITNRVGPTAHAEWKAHGKAAAAAACIAALQFFRS